MGVAGGFKSFLRRLRAAVRATVNNGGKEQSKFQYDPSSYALNFDDGCRPPGSGRRGSGIKHAKYQEDDFTDIVWVYVVCKNPND